MQPLGPLLHEVVGDRVSRRELGHEQHSPVAEELALGLLGFGFKIRDDRKQVLLLI